MEMKKVTVRGEVTCHVEEGILSENKVPTLGGMKDGSFHTSPSPLGLVTEETLSRVLDE